MPSEHQEREADRPQDAAATENRAATEASWRDSLSPEQRQVASKFASPADVVKSYAELEARLGRSITPPDEAADAEEWERYYNRLGRPATPEGYEFERPTLPDHLKPDDVARARERSFLESMHRAGAPQGVVQAVFDWYYGEVAGMDQATREHLAERKGAEEASLRREWGADYDRNREFAERALGRFGGADVRARLADIVGDPALLKTFAEIGRRMGEDEMITGSHHDGTKESEDDELARLMSAADYWTNAKTQARVRTIFEQRYGTRKINEAPKG